MPRTALVTCETCFEASHVLRREEWSPAENDRVFGNCARLHGHSYRLEVTLRGPIDPGSGMVINFREVKRVLAEEVNVALDHRHLNDVLPELPTAENLCHWLAERLLPRFGGLLHRLVLWETRTARAELDAAALAEIARELTGHRPLTA
jgi:6-pyruvoyltetrahydropterin/6-carboxytetrahydropterin synthase